MSDVYCSALSLRWLGWNAYLAGDASGSIEQFEECLFNLREIDNPNSYAPLIFLGRVFTSQGNIHKAAGCFREALELLKKIPEDTYLLAHCLEGICALPGIPIDRAAALLSKAETIREMEGFVLPISERPLVDPINERLQTQLGNDTFDSARAAGASLTYQQAVEEAIEVLQVMA